MKETKGKDRHYTQHTLFKGILPAAVVLFAIVAVFFFISGIVNRGGEQLQSNAELALTVTWSGSEYKGTYTGDASKDGTVEITILEQRKDHNGNMEAYSGSQATQELAIANGKFTFEGTEYTRQ